MRIAQVAPLYESVPPQKYGGTERVVSHLTEALIDRGHEVTLFASGDSQTRAELVSVCEQSLRLHEKFEDPLVPHILMLEKVFRRRHDFDIIHFHVDYLHFALSRCYQAPQLTTLHGKLTAPDLKSLYGEFSEMPLVSISNSQRAPLPDLNWVQTVHHGIPRNLYRFHPRPEDYFAFLGRISPEKGIDKAITIALRAGVPLRIAAKVDKVDKEYYTHVIEPMIRKAGSRVEFIGEINDEQKSDFLGNARALLFPICWPEPFGLVLLEAMACGTPVIAFDRGSVPEVVTPGRTGFICQTVDDAIEAISKLGSLNRLSCRNHFEAKFSSDRMARDYERAYTSLVRQIPDYEFDFEAAEIKAPALLEPAA